MYDPIETFDLLDRQRTSVSTRRSRAEIDRVGTPFVSQPRIERAEEWE